MDNVKLSPHSIALLNLNSEWIKLNIELDEERQALAEVNQRIDVITSKQNALQTTMDRIIADHVHITYSI